jgi:nucleoside-diphosphate-sugar epimerase
MLLERGYTVRALQWRTPVEPREGLEVVQGNTLDREAMNRAVEGVDAVLHLIRASNGPGDTRAEKWMNCCVVGTTNLLEAAREHGIKRFINGSADNVYGHTTMRHQMPLSEMHPKRFADGYYGLFKILEEELLHQYHIGFGIPTVVVRFPLIWTPLLLDSCAGTVDRKQKHLRLRLDVDGKPHVRHDIHVRDALTGVILGLEHEAAIGQDFFFTAAAPYSSDELVSRLEKKLGWPVQRFESDWHSWTADCAKARGVLGYAPEVDLLDWIVENVEG